MVSDIGGALAGKWLELQTGRLNREAARRSAAHARKEHEERRLQDAVAIVMLSQLDRWNRRLTETLTPHHSHLSRRVLHEVRIPNATELKQTILPAAGLPEPGGRCRLIIPIAFRQKNRLLAGFTIRSSHEPINVLNYDDGNAFTRRILSGLLVADGNPADFNQVLSLRLARVLKDRYIQFVELESRLGDAVTIEYQVRFRHTEGARDEWAAWRVALGWRQNRFSFNTDLHEHASSYHFHFEVPEGYILKDMSLCSPAHLPAIKHDFSGAGTPDGHMYVSRRPVAVQGDSSPIEIFVDCFEAPPGSQGYAAILGLIMTTILAALMAALEWGWLLDRDTGNFQATAAVALIASGPAVVASLLPLRAEAASAIRPPLTARLAVWASFAMSAFVALALATQGFGLDLKSLEGAHLGSIFVGGFLATGSAVVALLLCARTFNRQNFRGGIAWGALFLCIAALVLLQPQNLSAGDVFFGGFIPLFILTWLRCVIGWAKSFYVTSRASMRFTREKVVEFNKMSADAGGDA